MAKLLEKIDARTKLAGTNKLELLLFSLGRDQRTGRKETFGINVFKVREVMRAPSVTAAPEMPAGVEGMVSLRGALVPVVDLAKYAGVVTDSAPEIMMVTEYNNHSQGFLVESVDTILRLDWAAMKVPPEMLTAETGGLVTAVTEISDGRLVMLMDVEKILSETTHYDDEFAFKDLKPLDIPDCSVLYADDSHVARKQVSRALDALGVRHMGMVNGLQAWTELNRLADYAQANNLPVRRLVNAVVTDVEMPEMDGYMLTKHIKADPRFAGIPVIMHSSLSGGQNHELGKSVGVDEYVPKFAPQQLASALSRLIGGQAQK
jgi:two-component system, chemotaxis family, chemotaxis protein CheV